MFKYIFYPILFLFLFGCNNAADSQSTDEGLTITNSDSFTILENEYFNIYIDIMDENRTDLIYSITGVDESYFYCDPKTGNVQTKFKADYETKTSFFLTLEVSDSKNSSQKDISVTVKNLNDNTPSIDMEETIYVDENSKYVARAIGSDLDGDEIEYSISGTDGDYFDINPITGNFSFKEAPDYEVKNTYYIKVSVSDGSLDSFDDIVIRLNNLNDNSPEITTSSPVEVFENVNTFTVTATDPDYDSIEFSLSGDDKNFFDLNSSTGVVTFISNPDFEERFLYELTLTITDSENIVSRDLNISILDRNYTQISSFTSQENLILSSSNNYLIVSNTSEGDNGKVYLYEYNSSNKSSVELLQEIEPTGLDTHMNFGGDLEFYNDYFVVSASGCSSVSNCEYSVYLYKLENQQATLIDTIINEESAYVNFLSFHNNTIAIGSSDEKARVYKLESNESITKVAEFENYGASLDLYGDYLVLNQKNTTLETYEVNIYKLDTSSYNSYVQIASLTDSKSYFYDYGFRLSLEESYLAVGTQSEIYLYKINSDNFNDTSEIGKISNSNLAQTFVLSYSLELKNSMIFLGTNLDDTYGKDAGSVLIYKINSDSYNDISLIDKIQGSSYNDEGYFGRSLTFNGEYLSVGTFNSGWYIFKEDNTTK